MFSDQAKIDYRSYYQNNQVSVDDTTRVGLMKHILRIINFKKLKNKNILEVGFGSGLLLKMLSRSCNEITGIDISKKNIDELTTVLVKENLSPKLVQGDILNLPLLDDIFDIIICAEVLEHVTNVNKAIQELKRVTRPGGIMVISVPNEEIIKYEFCVHCRNLTPRNGHLNSFNREEFSSLLNSLGLKIEKTKIISSKIYALSFLKIFYFTPFSVIIDIIDRLISRYFHIFPPLLIIKIRKPDFIQD